MWLRSLPPLLRRRHGNEGSYVRPALSSHHGVRDSLREGECTSGVRRVCLGGIALDAVLP